jgi:hypothetical protein
VPSLKLLKKKTYFALKNFYIGVFITFIFLLNVNLKADWTKVTQSSNGQSFYVDMETIIENKGFVYFWELIDYKKEDEYGDKSAKIYIEADCTNYKFKWIKLSYHKDAMAGDDVKVQSPSNIVSDWQFPNKNSTSMIVLDFVCKNKGITL